MGFFLINLIKSHTNAWINTLHIKIVHCLICWTRCGTVSISFIFVYFLRCLCNLNFKIEIRMQQHRGFEGAERNKKKTKIVYIYMYVALFLFVAADWNYSNVLTLLFYFKQGNWCIVLRSDSYLNLFFRSNFTIILTTIFVLEKQREGSQMGLFYSVTFVFVLNRCLIQVFCPRCIMNSSYAFHIFTWICLLAFLVTSLYPAKIKSYVRKDWISWFNF